MTVKMPRVAETVDEVSVVEWNVEAGQQVDAGTVLMKVETDKAIVEVPAPVAGTLVERLVDQDEDVTTGQPIAVIERV
jgi:2-oxoglutarate dehydrogenase E2 component (dihydrolipoamide succinyltransferase)